MTIRLSIIEHSLTDILERLADLPEDDAATALRERVELYQQTVQSWFLEPPAEAQRKDMLKRVLDLNVEVMRLGGAATRAPILEDEEDEDGAIAIPLRPKTKP